MKKLLITGGCGFIGTNLVHYLLAHDATKIVVFDNEHLGKREHLTGCDITFIKGDIRDQAALGEAMKDVDAVVHLAADTRVMDSIADPTFNFEVNVIGTYNVLTAARKVGVKRVVNASTGGAILGEAPSPVNETMAPRPISPYGASKLMLEGYSSAFSGSYGMSIVCLRFSNIYGPFSYHKGSVVAAFFRQILCGEELVVYGDGTQIRDYLFSKDICNVIHRCLKSPVPSGIYQLGTGQPATLNALIEKIRHVVGSSYDIDVRHESFRSGEIHTTYGDISKARRDLDFNPTTSMDNGLTQTWEWFTKHIADQPSP